MSEQTDYLPSERDTPVEVGRELIHVATSDIAREIAHINDMALVFNSARQIVFANELFMEYIGFISLEAVISKRLGEVLGCVNAHLHKGGCGTSEKCQLCILAQAFEKCLNGDGTQEGECFISSNSSVIDCVPINFRLEPFNIGDEQYYMAVLKIG